MEFNKECFWDSTIIALVCMDGAYYNMAHVLKNFSIIQFKRIEHVSVI